MDNLKDRLKEPSSITALIAAAAILFNWSITEVAYVNELATAVMGVVLLITKEEKKDAN